MHRSAPRALYLTSPSGTNRTTSDVRLESAFRGKADYMCSERVFRLLTQRTSDAAEPILSAKQEADAIIGLQEPGYSYSPAPPRSDFLAEPSLFRAFHETSLL